MSNLFGALLALGLIWGLGGCASEPSKKPTGAFAKTNQVLYLRGAEMIQPAEPQEPGGLVQSNMAQQADAKKKQRDDSSVATLEPGLGVFDYPPIIEKRGYHILSVQNGHPDIVYELEKNHQHYQLILTRSQDDEDPDQVAQISAAPLYQIAQTAKKPIQQATANQKSPKDS